MQPKLVLQPRHHTSPFIWCVAIACAVLISAVTLTSLAVFISYLVIKPRVPRITITAAQLDAADLYPGGLLTVSLTAAFTSDNRNAHATAAFYATDFALRFRGRRIATLKATPYSVAANASVEFSYAVQSGPIPLKPNDGKRVGALLERRAGVIRFEVDGRTKTRWRVWLIGSAKSWLNLDCGLLLPVNGTRVYPHCSSSYKKLHT